MALISMLLSLRKDIPDLPPKSQARGWHTHQLAAISNSSDISTVGSTVGSSSNFVTYLLLTVLSEEEGYIPHAGVI